MNDHMNVEEYMNYVGLTVSERVPVRAFFAALRADGWRVVKLEEATFDDGHLGVILHGTHNVVEELT